jgi:photosystem II stability/assembly factor-like uncharacterized protein
MSATVLYVSGDQGVATLKKNGGDWRLESHGLQDWAVPKVGIAQSKPGRIFAGTRGDGVWLSEDFGNKWTKPSYGKRGPGSWRRPTGAESYLLKTTDGGKNWQKLNDGPNNGGKSFTEVLVFDDESPNQMYAGTRAGDIYSSDDSGESWRKLEIKVSSISDMKCVHA